MGKPHQRCQRRAHQSCAIALWRTAGALTRIYCVGCPSCLRTQYDSGLNDKSKREPPPPPLLYPLRVVLDTSVTLCSPLHSVFLTLFDGRWLNLGLLCCACWQTMARAEYYPPTNRKIVYSCWDDSVLRLSVFGCVCVVSAVGHAGSWWNYGTSSAESQILQRNKLNVC